MSGGQPSLQSVLKQLEGAELALCQATKSAIQASIERDAAQQQSAQRESQLDSKLSKLQAELAASQRQVEELRLALFARQSQAEEDLLGEQKRHAKELEARLQAGEREAQKRQQALEEATRRCAHLEERLATVQTRRTSDLEGWTHDVSGLRRRLAGLEGAVRQLSVLSRMPDDERRDAVLAKYDRLLERQRVAVRQPGAAADDAARSALEAQLIRKDLLRMAEDLRHRLARMRREGAACGGA